MLLTLPPELIEHIVRFSLPDEAISTYNERQDTLRAACLVHSLLRLIAQPKLGEVVVVRSILALQAVSSRVKSVGVEEVKPREHPLAAYFRLYESKPDCRYALYGLSQLPTLRKLALRTDSKVDLKLFEKLPYLSHLALSSLNLVDTDFSLKRVKQPTSSYLQGSDCKYFHPSPAHFPALEALTYGDTKVSMNCDMLQQLTALTTYDSDFACPNPCLVLRNFAFRILLSTFDFLHLASTTGYARPWVNTVDEFLRLTSAHLESLSLTISKTPLTLTRLYLPTAFDPKNPESHRLELGLKSFLDACASSNVVVVFEDMDYALGAHRNSQDFLEYAKRLRREEEEAGGADMR